jgi:N-sulfoglucosamine sulfohydrolase
MKNPIYLSLIFIAFLVAGCNQTKKELPNILWITSEDNSRMMGCYGDPLATTPHLDRLAAEGFLYTNAYANTPVCAPARNTILTGVHACSAGNEQMRSYYAKSELVRPYTEYLMARGYYCTNNSKTDYNFANIHLDEIWDECGNEAHYRNRGEGQPFFAIFNFTTSHESSIHRSIPDSALRHRPEEVSLPPYHPDTPEMRHDWAQYYDKVEDMDKQVGEVLAELEKAGLAENTIVFYYSDHGGILGRSKRFLYETGTHVPMIIRIPEKYKRLFPARKTGSHVERLVSFVDLAPTLLSMTGTRAPEYMQGSAFLGKYREREPEYVYMFRDRMDGRYDMSRSIVDRNFRYTRNFNSNRPCLQHLEYLWRAPSMQSWEKAYLSGQCNEVQSRWWNAKPVEELYDTENDPWEVNNLAGDPAFEKRLTVMRRASREIGASMKDAGFIPEADRILRIGDMAAYDYMRSEMVPFGEIQNAAYTASGTDPGSIEELVSWLDHDDSAIRYWAAQGLLMLGETSRPFLEKVAGAAFDPSWNVSVAAAELLYLLGEKETAIEAYGRVLRCDEPMARVHALNSIDLIGGSPEVFLESCLDVLGNYEALANQYDVLMIKWMFEKWGIDPTSRGVEFTR